MNTTTLGCGQIIIGAMGFTDHGAGIPLDMVGTIGVGMLVGVMDGTIGVGIQDLVGVHHIMLMEVIMATIIAMSLIIQHDVEVMLQIQAEIALVTTMAEALPQDGVQQ
jgi:hypothetical protein